MEKRENFTMGNKFKDNLYKILKKDARLWDEEKKEINETLLKDLIDKLDEKIIELLLSDKEIKEKFFIRIKDVFVLKHNDLKFFIDENKLDNSYTQYQNKIGLRVGNKLLSEREEVVLDWPFKDCVLEGGMTKEDQKRNEVFFNEVLAKDEIDRLFDPKAFTNFKRIDRDGEHSMLSLRGSDSDRGNLGFRRDENGVIKDNLIIKGNNLLVLHCLKEQFAGKVKLIYIDPPYNTEGENNTFVYNNSFNHSSWLTFIKNRLDIAKTLLSDEGVIVVTIDDSEQAHLKILSDEVFGRENFVGTVIVQSNPRGRTTNTHFATSHEYAMFYAKDIDQVSLNFLKLTKEQELDFDKKDNSGDYRLLPFRRSGGTSTPEERPNSYYPIYFDEKNNIFALDKKSGYIEIFPIDKLGKKRVWRQTRPSFLEAVKRGDMVCKKTTGKCVIYMKDRIKDGRKPKTIWIDSKYDASANGTMLLKNIFSGDKLFSYPKSLYTVKDTIDIVTERGKEDIVLDFFAGSGTTAHAVLELNKEDGGNRQFILCEQMHYVDTVTKERVKKVIENNKAGDFVYLEIAKWNEEAKERILKAKNLSELEKLFDELYERYFINYNVEIKKFQESVKEEEFKKLGLDKQKKLFVEMLDLNQMYVNFSERADKKYNLSKADIALSEEFYLPR
ncbi:MAG: site-specific DNA-methyltransferase [Candidatus Omnitrophota bacterium]